MRRVTLFALRLILSACWLPVLSHSAAFTYQGRVSSGGSDFSGTGEFKFALVTSTNANLPAKATAIVNSGFVTSYILTDGGSGYVTPPIVTISGGGGTGAAATANLSDGSVVSLTVTSVGSGYTDGVPSVTLSPPPPSITFTTYWSNDSTSDAGSEPISAVSVPVSNGLFTVVLGNPALPNMTAIDPSVFGQANLQLRIWFNDGVNGFAPLSPAQDLTATPYAVVADSATHLSGSLSATQLDGLVGNEQLENSQFSVTAGTGLTGGGVVALGGSTTLHNAGVLSVSGDAGITALTVDGAVTLGTTATSTNVGGAIVRRDADGSVSVGSVTLDGALSFQNPVIIRTAGAVALRADSPNGNLLAGVQAGAALVEGAYNVASGALALSGCTNGNNNAAVGGFALGQIGQSDFNTALGGSALYNLTSGIGNIALGGQAGYSLLNGDYNIYIGSDAPSGESTTIRLGLNPARSQTFIGGISGVTLSPAGAAVYVNSAGQLGTVNSSARLKEDIQDMDRASEVLVSLRPVTFRYKSELDPAQTPQFGLIAEEVDRVAPDLVVRDEKNQVQTVRYEAVNAMLLNEFLKQHHQLEGQQRALDHQEAEIHELQQRLCEELRRRDRDQADLERELGELKQLINALVEEPLPNLADRP
jgi:hypothetical protein